MLGGLWQQARQRTCWGVGFLDGNSYELPSRGQDNESKREVRIPVVGAGVSPIHPAELLCAARTHMEHGVPKSR